jgi:hypothetical protein
VAWAEQLAALTPVCMGQSIAQAKSLAPLDAAPGDALPPL